MDCAALSNSDGYLPYVSASAWQATFQSHRRCLPNEDMKDAEDITAMRPECLDHLSSSI